MKLADRKRREKFILGFGYLYMHPSETMAVKCWKRCRAALGDDDLDALISAQMEAAAVIAHSSDREAAE